MPDFPDVFLEGPPVISPWHYPESASGFMGFGGMGAAASTTWVTGNTAVYYPFMLTGVVTVVDLYWWVGATQGGNVDVGIYDAQKNRLVSSGSTAMSATVNTIQVLSCTDTTLLPGDYLMGGVCSVNTGTIFVGASGVTDETGLVMAPIYEQASALPLPDPCVPVVSTGTTFITNPGFGAICRSVF